MLAFEKSANTQGNSSEGGTETGSTSGTELLALSSEKLTNPEAVQDVHWDRIPVDGNPRRLQFRCLIGDTIHCTSWQNPHCFKKHFETFHHMVPTGARRGRPRSRTESGSQSNRLQRLTDRPARTDSGRQQTNRIQNITDRSSGHFPSKWWKRQKYQLETILRKVTKQLHQKGVKDPEVIRQKATEYYSEWTTSDSARSTKQKLAETTITYWVNKGRSPEEAARKGGVPADLHESTSLEAKPVIMNDSGVLKIGRKVRAASDEESRMRGGLTTACDGDEEKVEEDRSTSEEEEGIQEQNRGFLLLESSSRADEEQGTPENSNHGEQGRSLLAERSMPTACSVSRQDELTEELDAQHSGGRRVGGVPPCPECIY
ncbi:hypothetical protein R1sor_023294 [Riccia sorocarpa]|uniref:ROS1-like protein n=1 Tax=Riccia sorocarpa TaxID=122646 RepID=A0ABD3GMC6_9MARC